MSEDEALIEFTKDIPLRRANDPEDIAAMTVFLASPGARNITGQAYNVDWRLGDELMGRDLIKEMGLSRIPPHSRRPGGGQGSCPRRITIVVRSNN